MKKVLLIVIDALTARIVEPALADGRLPLMAELARRGVLRSECTSIFPSITPAATASIVTGNYPLEHGIAGAFWYDEQQRRVAYYGDDFWVIMHEGFGQYFHDYLVKLNSERLKSDTLFEQVERAGLCAAVVNYMWFRGDVEHEVNAPLMLKMWPGVSFAPHVRGPQVMIVGDFVQSPAPGGQEPLQAPGGVSHRYGFHDETTGEYLRQLFGSGKVPDFTLAYFPNNDFESHKVGPAAAASALEQIDVTLGTLADEYGGLDRLLSEVAIVITGDHSQVDQSSDARERGIFLDQLLKDFRLVPAGEEWSDGEELMVCPNMRAVQVYLNSPSEDLRNRVIQRLLSEPRVDQVMWMDRGGPTGVFHVWSSQRGSLRFWRNAAAGPPNGRDRYGNEWSWEGDLAVVDASLDGSGGLQYGDYPNALERVVGGFSDVGGDLWATAVVGSEFCLPQTNVHPGGSHGSLHRLDSTAPLLVAGHPDGIPVPEFPRIIDVAPLCRAILGIDS